MNNEKALKVIKSHLERLNQRKLAVDEKVSLTFRYVQSVELLVQSEVASKLEQAVVGLENGTSLERIINYLTRSLLVKAKRVTSNNTGDNIEVEALASTLEYLQGVLEFSKEK